MVAITVNGERREVTADPETPLLWALRERLGQGWSGVRANLSRWMRESEPRITRVAALAE